MFRPETHFDRPREPEHQQEKGSSFDLLRSSFGEQQRTQEQAAYGPRLLTDQERENLEESLRSIVKEDRRKGNSRSTVPDLRNMTKSQFLLEALSKHDWSNRLQEKGVEVHEPTFRSIGQRLTEIDPLNLRDYNTAVRNFDKTLAQFKNKDLAALRVEPAGLQGGGFYKYASTHQRYYGRLMTLKDPEGYDRVFNKGQANSSIVTAITRMVEYYKHRYATQMVEYYRRQYTAQGLQYHPTAEHFEYYKAQYNKGEALTENEVEALQQGDSIHGWNCTQLTYFSLEKRVYYTDRGTEIHALDLSSYEPFSREVHNSSVPHPPLEDPTSMFNCYSEFIDRQAWLVTDHTGRHIQAILDENRYYPVGDQNAKIDDIVAYYKPDGSIEHIARIVSRDLGKTIVESKPGDYGLIQHDIDDPWAIQAFGSQRVIYHTEREGGHSLRTTRP